MKKIFKRFWHWLRCEDENGNLIYERSNVFSFVYSELIKRFPIHGEITDDDIFQLSHKLHNGKYETCYITLSQLKQSLKENKNE